MLCRIACVISFVAASSALLEVSRPPMPSVPQRAAITPAHVHPVAQQVWELAREHFYRDDISHARWRELRDQHLLDIPADADHDTRSTAINAMLAELGVSHTHHFAPNATAFYDMLDLFFQAADNAADDPVHFPHGGTYVGIEIVTRVIDGRTFIREVRSGGPADRAGLLVGDEIISADGAPYQEIESFRDKAGRKVEVTVRRHRDGPEITITVTPHHIRPNDFYERALRDSARLIEHGGKQIAYVRVWSYAGRRYQDAVLEVLSGDDLHEADAIVLDIRGGWGGAGMEYVWPFLRIMPRVDMIMRDGERRRVSPRFDKPVAVLIDEGSRSGKELMAYAFRHFDVPLIGETTAGAVVGGRPFLLDDGSMLMLAVVDVEVNGERLEGKGVAPTIHVPFDFPYAAGADSQLDAALNLLAHE